MTSRKLDSDSVSSQGREYLSDWLVRHAARKAPADLAERLEEEWRADMASRTTYLSRLRFALGCCWATQVIAYEHEPARAAASAASGGGSVLSLSESYNGSFSGRGSSLLAVVALHAAVFYALFTWVTRIHVAPEPPHLVPHYVPRTASPPDVPKSPPPDLNQINRTLDVPQPEFPPIGEGGPTVTAVESAPLTAGIETPVPSHVIKRDQGGTGAGFPNVDEYYPSPEIRMGHQGATIVSVCVDPRGKLDSKPALKETSGYDRLDEAALRLAQAGSGHYRATTEDGQPVSSCYPIKVRFQLKN